MLVRYRSWAHPFGGIGLRVPGDDLCGGFFFPFSFFGWLLFLAFMIPHPCLDTLSRNEIFRIFSTAKVLLRHRWDGVLDRD